MDARNTEYGKRNTVFVGLSGGVDSAVSAALIKEQGHHVVGAFIKIWRPEFIECPWENERLDAMRVCAHLGIPFKEIDLSEEYKKAVIDDLVENYARGATPNPDVLCNRHIKFGAFKKWALREGAEMIATGHYARIYGHPMSIYRGKDSNKDQSYFLWQLTRDDLQKTLFPVGEYTKPEVRVLAERFQLPVARKHDSQGLCFVGDVSMDEFLARYLPLEKGKVLDGHGVEIGEHDGAALFTLGKRHGFRVANRSSSDAPLYVVAIDTDANTITVAPSLEHSYVREVDLRDTNWLVDVAGKRVFAQARYREAPVACLVEGERVHFDEPHLAPRGQSLVIYDGDELLGGGLIA